MAAAIRRYDFAFRGTASEYFGIWIVNILLTILTLGIYSAWAKVRRQRYFYGNTVIDDHAFEYHARPVQILIGRIIAVAVIVLLSVISSLAPAAQIVFLPLYIFGIPFVIQRGTRFAARVTSYRNVRFDFVGSYGGAMKVVVLGGILSIFSLGLLIPVVSRWSAQYFISNHRYGGRPFILGDRSEEPADVPFPQSNIVSIGRLYGAFFLAVGAGLLVIVAAIAFTFSTMRVSTQAGPAIALMPYMVIVVVAVGGLGYRAVARNVFYSATTLEGRHALQSSVDWGRFVWISISNTIVSIVTIGLMRPWAAVRMARYLASATAIDSAGDFDAYAGDLVSATGVASAEFMDLEGVDLGFGF